MVSGLGQRRIVTNPQLEQRLYEARIKRWRCGVCNAPIVPGEKKCDIHK